MADPMTVLGSLRAFLNDGGPVMWLIFVASFLLWCVVAERLIYLTWLRRGLESRLLTYWRSLPAGQDWMRAQVQRRLVSVFDQRLQQRMPLIRSLVAVCPLLGLLGTVTGMMMVFDVLALVGSGNARAMADGVSRATLPTLAGMVVSLSGLIVSLVIQRRLRAVRLGFELRLSDTSGQGGRTYA